MHVMLVYCYKNLGVEDGEVKIVPFVVKFSIKFAIHVPVQNEIQI